MGFRKVRVTEAVGMVLAHDISKIVPGEYKGPAFKKGHVIREEDIDHLRDIGKEHIFLLELGPGQVHENDAIQRIAAAVAGKNVALSAPSEGRINLRAEIDGLLKIRRKAVQAINMVEHAVVSTLHENRMVRAGDLLAGIKVVPLVVDETMVAAVEAIAGQHDGIVTVKPVYPLRIGVVITGSEVYYGRIQDKYGPVFAEKVEKFGAVPMGTVYQPDDAAGIAAAIKGHIARGAEVVIAAGGMSVDPDDVTPEAIRLTGAEVVTYGSPVLPGAMFMLAYLGNTAILGMPACGMYSRVTVFDLVFPRILAGERLTKEDIAVLGYGGLCRGCAVCTSPDCSFGK